MRVAASKIVSRVSQQRATGPNPRLTLNRSLLGVHVEITVESPEAREKRSTFFKLAYGRYSGFVCIATLTPPKGTKKGKFDQEFFHFPEELDRMLDYIEQEAPHKNLYFCPQLFNDRIREKGNVEHAPNIWADLDYCNPDNLMVEPSLVLESSPDRFQALWCLEKDMDPDDAEEMSRRIAYTHAHEGADRSGWDLTQLLRVPYTYNFKYMEGTELPVVQILVAKRSKFRPDDFSDYPEDPGYTKSEIPIPNEEDLPEMSADELLQAKRMEMNPRVWGLFVDEPMPGPNGQSMWSQALWNLEMLLFESGFTRMEVYAIVREAKCNKYARDGKPALMLWKDVCRAEAKAQINQQLLTARPEKLEELLSEEERAFVDRSPDTFVERYIRWASSLGDAAPQYHQAGAFIVLSSLLAGSVRLPTSYGTVIPNIWFMILGDTTLTRKTTAMDIAMDLVAEIDDDVVMATDGSIEGLMTSLAARPGRPSVFLRDEFSGLLEQMTKKDYMAGMPETLTKLYDGKLQKRILRKEIIEVREPRLVIFAGGIKNKVTSLLTYEYVSSGFMPRFCFVTAESDLNRIRPIGPPALKTTGPRDEILAELNDMFKFYNRTQQMHIDRLNTSIEQKVIVDAQLTDDAWVRYNKLESALLDFGIRSDKPDIMTPIGDRLSKSILKAAILIAASEQREDVVTVEELHILRAIKYGENWQVYATEVMNNVGRPQMENQLEKIYNAIEKKPGGVPRSLIMQNYHLNAREANLAFETLEQRGMITRQRSGRTELLIAIRGGA